jgi:hypothetical protein
MATFKGERGHCLDMNAGIETEGLKVSLSWRLILNYRGGMMLKPL